MSYLTQGIIARTIVAQKRISDSYRWHKTLWTLFRIGNSSNRPFLFRIDDKPPAVKVLILSKIPPVHSDWGAWETKQIPDRFFTHPHYRFAIRTNPTVKRVVRDESGARKKNGRRVGILDDDELQKWFREKVAASGIEIDSLSIAPPIQQPFYRKGRYGKHLSVDVSGLFTVRNQERFKNAVHRGIGTARAFGFGLFLLQPVEISRSVRRIGNETN